LDSLFLDMVPVASHYSHNLKYHEDHKKNRDEIPVR
jgi:hypothetical protein